MAGSNAVAVGTVVIGAGQAGLAAACSLARRRQDFVVLEAADRVGQSWRQRWNSLRLFTPAGFTRLPGLPFPAAPDEYPGQDAVADYLEGYARHFALPVELGAPVTDVRRDGEEFVVGSGSRSWRARNVVLASGAHGSPYVPEAAGSCGPGSSSCTRATTGGPGSCPTARCSSWGQATPGHRSQRSLHRHAR